NLAQIMPAYLEALADVPPDLVEIALKHVRQNLKWFPKPCELREPIAGVLEARRRAHAGRQRRAAEHAAHPRQRDAPPAAAYRPDDAIRERAMAEIRETLAAAKPARAGIATYRSDTPGANQRRAMLRSAADASFRRVMGLPDPDAGETAA